MRRSPMITGGHHSSGGDGRCAAKRELQTSQLANLLFCSWACSCSSCRIWSEAVSKSPPSLFLFCQRCKLYGPCEMSAEVSIADFASRVSSLIRYVQPLSLENHSLDTRWVGLFSWPVEQSSLQFLGPLESRRIIWISCWFSWAEVNLYCGW